MGLKSVIETSILSLFKTACRSAIFYHDADQQSQANEVKDMLQKTKIKNPIVTEIVPFENWWDAEEYHQKYLVNNPGTCHG